jgi:hypothetical protein
MPDSHPLVCRFGALGDMVLITPLLRLLYQRSGLPCDVVGIGGFNRSLFAEMPCVRDVYSIDSRSMPYWFNRSQRELVSILRQKQHRFVWLCETSKKSYRLLARAGITRANSINQLDLVAVSNEHYCDSWLCLGGHRACACRRGVELPAGGAVRQGRPGAFPPGQPLQPGKSHPGFCRIWRRGQHRSYQRAAGFCRMASLPTASQSIEPCAIPG